MPYFRKVLVDNVTIEYDESNRLRIKDGGVTETKIADGAITFLKLADDAKVKYKFVSGTVTASANSEVTICSLTVNANEFKEFYVVFGLFAPFSSAVGGQSSSGEINHYYYLYEDSTVVASLTGAVTSDGKTVNAGPSAYTETDVTTTHTFSMTVKNLGGYDVNYVRGFLVVMGI